GPQRHADAVPRRARGEVVGIRPTAEVGVHGMWADLPREEEPRCDDEVSESMKVRSVSRGDTQRHAGSDVDPQRGAYGVLRLQDDVSEAELRVVDADALERDRDTLHGHLRAASRVE